ncbi:MAG: DUF1638 domain-containing protein [Anaerolineae bacterium]|nr:DUF1638 domain-containing protein [Anaerolineae bacterium]
MSSYIALTCSALARSIYGMAAASPHIITVRLFDQGLHNTPGNLRQMLQAAVDAVEPGEADAILLVYGICGTSTLGVRTRHTPLVMPRAHDCITLYLGSRERYEEEFNAHPGTYWYSADYLERSKSGGGLGASLPGVIDNVYEDYVARYGKDNADYLMEVMGEWGKHYTRAVFIDTDQGDTEQFERIAHTQAQQRGWLYERKQGNRRLLEQLISGEWSDDEFLVVPPGHVLRQASDSGLIKAVPE